MLNPSNLSDVKSQLEDSSGIQALRGRILLAQEVTQNSFVGRLQDESAATYTKNFGSVEVIEKLKELRRNATAAREGIGNILSDLEISAKNYETIRLKIINDPESLKLPPSKAKELVESLKGLNVAEARATLRTYFKATLDSLSDSGQIFTSSLQAFGSEFEDFTTNFAKFTQTEFVDKLTTLNEILRIGNIQIPGGQGALLKGVGTSRLNISAPLQEFQGTDTEVTQSRIKTLTNIQRDTNAIISVITDNYPTAGGSMPVPTFSGLSTAKVPTFTTGGPVEFGAPPSLARKASEVIGKVPTFAEVPKTPNEAELARLRQIANATPEKITELKVELSNKRIDAIQSSLRGDAGFSSLQLKRNPDLIQKLTAAGLSSSIEDRAADALSPIRRTGGMEASLDRQLNVANILKDEAERVGNTKRVFDIEVQIQELYYQRALIVRDSRPEAFFEGMLEGLTTAKEKLTEFGTMGKLIGADIKNSFGEAFTNIVTGTMSVSDAFASMAANIMKNVAQIFAQKAAAQLINMVLGSFISTAAASVPNGTPSPGMNYDPALGYATGGPVRGGSGYRDDVPALLMGGEYVINKRAAMEIGHHNLDYLNRGNLPRFAAGGPVGSMAGLRSGSSFASSSPVTNYHTSTVTINIDQNGKAQANTQSSALDARELSDAIEGLIEDKFQQKMRAGQQLNPMNRR
jgi:lambda family phage tail tape measure protein